MFSGCRQSRALQVEYPALDLLGLAHVPEAVSYTHLDVYKRQVEMGGLLGSAPVIPVHKASSADFIHRGGRIPAPLHSLKN